MKIINKKTGFTLLETLVAIAVFMTAILGPTALAVYSMRSLSHGRDQVTAYYLAEDALEYIKNKKDSNKIDGNEWTDGLSECVQEGLKKRCYIDTINETETKCDPLIVWPNSGTCSVKLNYHSDTGFYDYLFTDPFEETIFTRTIKILEIANHSGGSEDDEAKITVEVFWQEKSVTKSFTLESYIFDY